MPLDISVLCRALLGFFCTLALSGVAADAGEQSGADATASTVSPIATSKTMAQQGKATYLRLCQYCHGFDGKALANIDFLATNLTDLSGWKYGTDAASIFNSIKNGAGDDMPAFSSKLSDEQIWQLVAFVLSIGPQERRPAND